ncbi:MAG: phosphatase PAP2 family protein [Microthrixaceae bacterium]|nr:phosphatase PAP2 family protein [Microthrixaceae bacterium]MCB9387510.1 phosphatase PAP2 family protein [Microthrixaceae bacterium]
MKIAGGAMVLGAGSLVALDGVPRWEEDLFELLNRGSDGAEWVLWAPMQVGSLFGPVVVGALTWWRWRKWRPSGGSVVAGVVAWQVAKIIKNAVARGRPFELVDGFNRRVGTPMEGLGYVSGHSAVAFALASVCSPYLGRRGRAGAFALATLVGFSRIQVSAHLPLDVLGGAALGYGLGNLWNLAVGVPERSDAVDPGGRSLE